MIDYIEQKLECAINTHQWNQARKWQQLRNWWCYGTKLVALIGY